MIDRKSVDAMANILRAFHGSVDGVATETAGPMPLAESSVSGKELTPEAQAMKEILTRLQGENGVIESLARTSETDPELREALMTERTDKGARIGRWNIIVKEGEIKTYDVATDDGTVIASDLYLYEAAYGLVKYLNAGYPINSKPVRELLEKEEQYARVRTDALTYKMRSKSHRERGNDFRAAVNEDRLAEASRQAEKLHEEILRLSGLHH
jgi:hypothetical protein